MMASVQVLKVLIHLAKLVPAIHGRLRVQKSMYLLQQAGVTELKNTCFRFASYGPHSAGVDQAILYAIENKVLYNPNDVMDQTFNRPFIYCGDAGKDHELGLSPLLPQSAQIVEDLAEPLTTLNWRALELAASALFLAQQDKLPLAEAMENTMQLYSRATYPNFVDEAMELCARIQTPPKPLPIESTEMRDRYKDVLGSHSIDKLETLRHHALDVADRAEARIRMLLHKAYLPALGPPPSWWHRELSFLLRDEGSEGRLLPQAAIISAETLVQAVCAATNAPEAARMAIGPYNSLEIHWDCPHKLIWTVYPPKLVWPGVNVRVYAREDKDKTPLSAQYLCNATSVVSHALKYLEKCPSEPSADE